MARNRNQLIFLGVTVVVLAVVLWLEFGQGGGPEAPLSADPAVAAGTGAGPREIARPVPPVALGRLGGEAVEPNDTGRDPFRFGAAGRGRGPGRGGRGGDAAAPPVPAVAPVPVPSEPVVTGPPPPPPIPLKFIALVVTKRAGTRIAMLTDGRGVYSGMEGAVIEGRYRILKIANDSIDMAYLDGRGRRTIPLSGS